MITRLAFSRAEAWRIGRIRGVLATRRSHPSLHIAWVHAWWGDKDAAFSALERSREQQQSGLHLPKADPLLRGLRGDPRYAALLARLKLPPD